MSRFLRGPVAVVLACACGMQWLAANSLRAEETTNSLGMRLRRIEAGRFERGEHDTGPGFHKDHSAFNTADDDRPMHPVVLTRPFFLAATEVTFGQFRRFVEDAGYVTTAESNPRGMVGWDPRSPANQPRYVGTFRDGDEFDWKHLGFEQTDDHPVAGVSFADAKAFCAWLSKKEGVAYRLPTEAEWEYAARAGTQTYFSFGNSYRGQIQRFANIGNVELERAFPDRVRRQWLVDPERDPADQHLFTAPAGSYEANPWGLFDLYGNVWEWCEDRYLDTAYAAFKRAGYQQVRQRAIDPVNLQQGSGDGDWRVIRGGSWFNAPIQCRSSVRGYFEAGEAACYLGFRVVREAAAVDVADARRSFEQSEAARAKLEGLIGPFQERRDGRLTLSMRHDQLGDELFAALAQCDEPVDLHVNGQLRMTAAQVAGLAKAPQLRGLVIGGAGPNLSDADFAVLANHPRLELLEISGTPGLSNGLLEHLRACERLESLRLEGNAITDAGLRLLPPQLPLKTLHLANTASQGHVLDHFNRSPLERFSCRQLSDEGAALLGRFARLQEATLSGSPITDRGLAEIARLPALYNLELSGCRELADEDFTVLGNLYGLRSVQLQQTAAGDRAVEGLVRLNNLRSLRIGSPQLTDAGARRICEIVALDNLALTADAVEVTDAALADLWRLANLRSLEIAAPQITGSGFESLDELPRLESLNLGSAALGDAALASAARSRSLKRIDLVRRGTRITDDGLATLRQRKPELTINVR